MKATQVVLESRPLGIPSFDNFRFEEIEIQPLKDGEILIQPIYISVDPYMRGRMNDVKSYVSPYEVNKPITGGIVGRVAESKNSLYSPGDIVQGNTLPWVTKIIHEGKGLQKINPDIAPISYYLGILGMPGLTAYFGLLDIGQPKSGETVVISGAAGAVGSVVGQIAKIKGCKVVGLVGSEEKVKLLKEQFGFDVAINYKSSKNLRKDIKAACPNDIDIYFDNVGGEISDAVLPNLNFKSRLAVCGQISLYNETRMQLGPRFLPIILTRSILVKGYIVNEYSERFPEGIQQLTEWVTEGKLKFKETFVKGFDKLPEAFLGLFSGQNQGKMLVQVEC
jgi:NADPH-dependent curcumin reductase CurA